MLVGYVRVSTADERQSTDLQRDALRAASAYTPLHPRRRAALRGGL